jgi:23S rRNA (uracil1939-C5)-methyltransferase
MGRASVAPPPGAFLQATEAGETILAKLVAEGVGQAAHVADLFAGVGTFSLRLAESAEIHAVETGKAMVLALSGAAGRADGLRAVTTEVRDLARRPLMPAECDRFDAIVLDPPRAGAQEQMKELVRSAVPVVISVSCNAGTFARDAAILVGGGFAIERITPVDQFRHSPHIEIVGVFRRPRQSAKRRRSLLK